MSVSCFQLVALPLVAKRQKESMNAALKCRICLKETQRYIWPSCFVVFPWKNQLAHRKWMTIPDYLEWPEQELRPKSGTRSYTTIYSCSPYSSSSMVKPRAKRCATQHLPCRSVRHQERESHQLPGHESVAEPDLWPLYWRSLLKRSHWI